MAMRTCYLVGLFCMVFSQSNWAKEPGELVWISIDRNFAATIKQSLVAMDITFEAAPVGAADHVQAFRIARHHLPAVTRVVHDQLDRCGGYRLHDNLQAALAVNGEIEQLARTAGKRGAVDYSLTNPTGVAALLDMVQAQPIADVIGSLSGFTNRFYDSIHGVNAANWLKDHWESLVRERDDVQVALFSHSGFPQPSVILTITGTVAPDEVVVLGGHLDSTLRTSGEVSPGADDDASGIATLTEVIRVMGITGYRPQRTVKFMGYAGEEHGLLGSEDIADTHASDGVNVVGVLQLDMTNFQGSTQDIWFITDFTNGPQNAFAMDLIDTYLPDLTYSTDTCGYPCSDHASWTFAGFPASMPFEARFGQHNSNLHSSNDTLAASGGDAEHAVKFARLAACFVAELAKGGTGDGPSMQQVPVTVDLLVDFMGNFGTCSEPHCPRDLNGDNAIDGADFSVLAGDWSASTCLGFGSGPVCP